jgi:alpha-beta hydrolase superfamily lysophospholipase
MEIAVDAIDRAEPIPMRASVVATVAGLPIVEYVHASVTGWQEAPTVVGFAGGGGSGAMLAMLAECCAARGVRLVSFDMPGHTPEGLLGAATPPRALLSRAGGAVRQAVGLAMIRRWRGRSAHLQVLSHSAGIVDISRLIKVYGHVIDRFVICGSAIPGLGAMTHAAKAAAAVQALGPIRMSTVIGTLQLPTATNELLYGPPSARSISDAALIRYECAEHFGVALAMLRARPVLSQDWRGRRVLLVGSSGDPIVPAARVIDAERRLRSRGALTRCEILPLGLPHAFLSFQGAAEPVAKLIAERVDEVEQVC